MNRYYYKKNKPLNIRFLLRIASLSVFAIGFVGMFYIFFPLISWQLYFAPVFAASNVASPIPKTVMVTPNTVQSLLASTFSGIDYNNIQNWFPTYNANLATKPKATSYTLSIPKLHIKDADVSTIDNELDKHLINYGGTALPPDNGNAVIFGHSSLPQLFDPQNYKTIFATAHTLQIGDEIIVTVSDIKYTYKIFSIIIVDPADTAALAQNYDNAYLTIVTCTPPGTTWKRLIIKSRIEKL
ncbi:MAG: sortase [Candidatus Levybacteria bacterium]|nr:sortase [Candidatus Levybacteria bacterium]